MNKLSLFLVMLILSTTPLFADFSCSLFENSANHACYQIKNNQSNQNMRFYIDYAELQDINVDGLVIDKQFGKKAADLVASYSGVECPQGIVVGHAEQVGRGTLPPEIGSLIYAQTPPATIAEYRTNRNGYFKEAYHYCFKLAYYPQKDLPALKKIAFMPVDTDELIPFAVASLLEHFVTFTTASDTYPIQEVHFVFTKDQQSKANLYQQQLDFYQKNPALITNNMATASQSRALDYQWKRPALIQPPKPAAQEQKPKKKEPSINIPNVVILSLGIAACSLVAAAIIYFWDRSQQKKKPIVGKTIAPTTIKIEAI